MSTEENRLAETCGFILGRATTPAPDPVTPAYCFSQPDGYEERRVGPGWGLVREEPGPGWQVSEPTSGVAELGRGLWA